MADSKTMSAQYGVKTENNLDFNQFKANRDEYICRLNGIYEKNLGDPKVNYIHKKVSFGNGGLLNVEGEDYKL